MRDASSNEEQVMPQDLTPATLARKRRIEQRKLQRSHGGDEELDGDSCAERKRARVEEVVLDPVTSKPKPSITGIKRQSRYDPGVTMNRDELKVWRKEARRVRNRESAADSRKRNRERVTELEGDVDVLQSKYAAALQRIVELEASAAVNDSFIPAILCQDLSNLMTSNESRPSSPEIRPIKTVSPPMSPSTSCIFAEEEQHAEVVTKKYQHIMDMISRPLACVTIT
jgi:hypothetical protein